MQFLETKFGPTPVDSHGENFFIKPSAIPHHEGGIEYGIPFEHTDPTYVMVAKVTMTWDDFYERYDEVFNAAADVVETYASMNFFGGFILSNDYVSTDKIAQELTIWVTNLSE